MTDELAKLKAENANLLDTIKAMLVACGGSEDDSELKRQLDAAGSKPSDFIRAIGGRLLSLIAKWQASGRYGYCLPVIHVELMSDIERILRGEPQQLHCGQCESRVTREDLMQFEGVCEHCCEQNRAELDAHNSQHDHWQSLSYDERQAMIDHMIK